MFGRRSSNASEGPAAGQPAGGGKVKPSVRPPGTGDGEELEQLWAPSQAKERKTVEQLLLERGHVSEENLAQARTVAGQTPGKSIAQILLTMNASSEGQILEALAETLSLPFEKLEKNSVSVDAFNTLPADYIRKQLVLPIRLEGE